jgi:TP901-1 family phage major tail protein
MASPPAVAFEITIPDFGVFDGTFQITSLEYGGETEGGQTFSLSLASVGEITFSAS